VGNTGKGLDANAHTLPEAMALAQADHDRKLAQIAQDTSHWPS
jgi:hypothetical protein